MIALALQGGCSLLPVARLPFYSGPLRPLEQTARLLNPGGVLSIDGKSVAAAIEKAKAGSSRNPTMVADVIPGRHRVVVELPMAANVPDKAPVRWNQPFTLEWVSKADKDYFLIIEHLNDKQATIKINESDGRGFREAIRRYEEQEQKARQ